MLGQYQFLPAVLLLWKREVVRAPVPLRKVTWHGSKNLRCRVYGDARVFFFQPMKKQFIPG